MLEWESLEFTLESAGVVPELTDDRKSRAPNYCLNMGLYPLLHK
jgi:hypothetical protein